MGTRIEHVIMDEDDTDFLNANIIQDFGIDRAAKNVNEWGDTIPSVFTPSDKLPSAEGIIDEAPHAEDIPLIEITPHPIVEEVIRETVIDFYPSGSFTTPAPQQRRQMSRGALMMIYASLAIGLICIVVLIIATANSGRSTYNPAINNTSANVVSTYTSVNGAANNFTPSPSYGTIPILALPNLKIWNDTLVHIVHDNGAYSSELLQNCTMPGVGAGLVSYPPLEVDCSFAPADGIPLANPSSHTATFDFMLMNNQWEASLSELSSGVVNDSSYHTLNYWK